MPFGPWPGEGGSGLTPEEAARLALIGFVVYEAVGSTTDFDLPIPGGPTESGDVEIIGRIVNAGVAATLELQPDGVTTNQASLAFVGNTALPAPVTVDQPGVLTLGDVTVAGGLSTFRARLAAFTGKNHPFISECYRLGVKAIWHVLGEWTSVVDPTFCRIHATAAAIGAGSWFAIRRIGLASLADTGDPLIAVDASNKTEAIQISGRPWVTAADDIWGGVAVTRYNHAATVRLLNWTPTSLTFAAVSMAVPNTNGSLFIGVLVNGALVASVAILPVSNPIEYTVAGLAAGAKTIELIEGFQARETHFDDGADGRVSACYVTGVRVPAGQAAPLRATAAVGTVVFGDSIVFGIPNQPWIANGWGAQVRAACHAAGQLFGVIGTGAGTLAGDGVTAAQVATEIHDLWAAMGTVTKQFIWFGRPNDFKYWDLGGSVQTTPAQLTAFLGAVLDALTVSDPGYVAYVVAPNIPQGVAQIGPNGGGHLRADYGANMLANLATGRPQVTFIDGTTWGLALPGDYSEAAPNEVHPDQSGHDKIATAIKTVLGV